MDGTVRKRRGKGGEREIKEGRDKIEEDEEGEES